LFGQAITLTNVNEQPSPVKRKEVVLIVRRGLVPEDGAVSVREDFAQSSKLTLEAKGLYLFLLTVKDPKYLTAAGIAFKLMESEEKVGEVLSELEEASLVAGSW
jgi:hypothetical protein